MSDLLKYEKFLLIFKEKITIFFPEKMLLFLKKIYIRLKIRIFLKNLRRYILLKQNGLPISLSPLNLLKETNPFSKFDLIHIPLPQNVAPFIHSPEHLKFVVTVHDIIHKLYPEFHTKENIYNSELGLEFIKSRKTSIISVSNNTKIDLENIYKLGNDIDIVYLGVNPTQFHVNKEQELSEKILTEFNLSNQKYFITLFTIEPRKNLDKTIEAFDLLVKSGYKDIKLVVVGKIGWHNKQEELVQHDNIIYTGFVADEYLCTLLNNAISLCYLSHYEGFGLPLIEALFCDAPTITSNNSSLAEIGKYTGILVNPNNSNAIKEAMEWMLNNPIKRAAMIEKNRINKSMFSWDEMAKKHIDIYLRELKIGEDVK